jgi:hypothetical protein
MKRVFIDPGSKSCGWALFEDGEFLEAGTLTSKQKNPFTRLGEIYDQAVQIAQEKNPEEARIEILNYKTNYVCIWAVAVIGVAFAKNGVTVSQEIPIKSWQSFANWAMIEDGWREVTEPQTFDSEDAYAAYWMGLWWLTKELIRKP